ncbi:GntR family transcriptional regulator [Streptomyces sp. FXJ1.4098]|nr:GntR family transcriptional regulator [Streptomyces sp. FXJ1.4098]
MGEPRYVVIAGDLMKKIAAGKWPVGELLPTEPELAAEYRVSRETLRRALKRLELGGLISRHPGPAHAWSGWRRWQRSPRSWGVSRS